MVRTFRRNPGVIATAVVSLALGISAVDLGLDWLFRMDQSQRAVMLALALGGLAYAAWKWLGVPLSTTISDDALCLEVERKHPALGQSLISALQLAKLDRVEERGMSAALVQHTVTQGAAAASGLNFADVLDGSGWRKNVALLALGIAAWLGVGAGIVSVNVPPTSIQNCQSAMIPQFRADHRLRFAIHQESGAGREAASVILPVIEATSLRGHGPAAPRHFRSRPLPTGLDAA